MKLNFILISVILICFAACSSTTSQHTAQSRTDISTQKELRMTPAHPTIESWAYVLQHPSVPLLAESPYRLIVIDYSKDGSDSKRFTSKDLAVMHRFNKTVLCYFSIGEAEAYRFYWKKDWNDTPPRFLGPENPDWAKNYKVKYWREDWWEMALRPYLDRILEAGFDGVYLDIVDAYWFWHEQGMDVQTTSDDMIKLIARIADYCRKRAGQNFIVCPQNGMGVFDSCSPVYRDLYFKKVDMVGLESLLFNIYSENDRDYRIKLARELAQAGKTILDVEYIDEKKYADYLQQVNKLDFKVIPYASKPDAALDVMTDFYKYRK